MADQGSATRTDSRTDAASMIAELWAEREEARSSAPPPGSPSPAGKTRPPRSGAPRSRADGPHRALAVAITLLLVGMWIGAITFGLGLMGLGWIHSRGFGIISTLAGIVFLVLIHDAIQAATAGLPF